MDRSKQSAIISLIVLCLCTTTPGKIIYVDDDANGLNDGSSWQSAYRHLQDALADANDSAKPTEIRVAQGIYKPDLGAGRKADDLEATFQLINGVVLEGGYAGLIEQDPNLRDAKLYESILSGDVIDPPDVPAEPDRRVRAFGGGADANDPRDMLSQVGCRTVVTGSGTDSTAVLDGFVITGGRYHASAVKMIPGQPAPVTGSGAGMNNLAGSPTVIACTFMRNSTAGVGSGMCNVGGSHPTVADCVFVDNYALGGGALANWKDSSPVLTRCAFRANGADRGGGAVHNHDSSPTFRDCTFVRNTVRSEGGAIYDDTSTSTLADCTFAENEASSGGAIYSHDNDNLSLEGCTFVGNLAGMGGAIFARGRNNNLVATACTFTRNSGRQGAGAVCSHGQGQLSGCRFSGNTSRRFGGAVDIRTGTFSHCLFLGNRALDGGAGGAVYSGGSMAPLHFINCTFAENYARWGSALWIWTGESTEVRNCILRGLQPSIWADPYDPQPRVTYCDIEGDWPGEGNVDVDPLFAKPGFWANADDPNRPGDPNDPNALWVDGDYHLKSLAGRWDPNEQRWVMDDVSSPCIDAGDPNSPVGEEPPPNGGRINLGAYGGTSEASKSRVPKTFNERLQDLLATIEGQSEEKPMIRKGRPYISIISAPSGTHFAVDPDYRSPVEKAANWFLRQWRDLFVSASNEVSFEMTRANTAVVRYHQKYAGLEVYGAELLIVFRRDGSIGSVTSNIQTDTSSLDMGEVSVTPSLDAATAQSDAIAFLAAQHASTTLEASSPILMIYAPSLRTQSGPLRLVWLMEVYDLGFRMHEKVLVDAHNGEVALHFSLHVQR